MPELFGDVDELIRLIRRSATQSELNAQEEARREREEILAEAAAKAEQLRTEAHNTAERDAETAHRRTLAQAELEIQRQRLQKREALLDRAWAEAEARLRKLADDPAYAEVLQRLAQTAAATLATDVVLLTADAQGYGLLTPERLAAWSDQVGTTFRRHSDPADIWGGLVASDEAGRRIVNNSFDVRLALARDELREQIADLLEIR
jgi:V/A-type H+-transporting ATPase subunit E